MYEWDFKTSLSRDQTINVKNDLPIETCSPLRIINQDNYDYCDIRD